MVTRDLREALMSAAVGFLFMVVVLQRLTAPAAPFSTPAPTFSGADPISSIAADQGSVSQRQREKLVSVRKGETQSASQPISCL
jgi:hypothetical protein